MSVITFPVPTPAPTDATTWVEDAEVIVIEAPLLVVAVGVPTKLLPMSVNTPPDVRIEGGDTDVIIGPTNEKVVDTSCPPTLIVSL